MQTDKLRRLLFSSSVASVIPLPSDASSLFQDMALKKTQHRKENQKCTIPKKKIVILLQWYLWRACVCLWFHVENFNQVKITRLLLCNSVASWCHIQYTYGKVGSPEMPPPLPPQAGRRAQDVQLRVRHDLRRETYRRINFFVWT